MAEVGGEEYLLVGLARQNQFAVSERAILKGTVDKYLVFIVSELLLEMRKREEEG